MPTTETPPRLLTLPEVAARLTVSRATAYRMVYDGRLPAVRLGGPGTPLRVDGKVRAFHDLTHTAITNDAASGSNPIAVMTKAGHADMKTTRRYMHLAGVVFCDEAVRLEERLLGPVKLSTDLSEPQPTSAD